MFYIEFKALDLAFLEFAISLASTCELSIGNSIIFFSMLYGLIGS